MSNEAPPAHGRSETLALGLTALAIVLADQATKAMVIAALAVGQRVEVVGDLVVLWHVQNTGAAFSLFQFNGSHLLFYAVTVVAVAMIIYFHHSFRGRAIWLHLILGLILGGTLGNLIDRLRLGYVTDFVSVGFGATRFPTWNVADAGITLGIAALVGYLLLFDRSRAEAGA